MAGKVPYGAPRVSNTLSKSRPGAPAQPPDRRDLPRDRDAFNPRGNGRARVRLDRRSVSLYASSGVAMHVGEVRHGQRAGAGEAGFARVGEFHISRSPVRAATSGASGDVRLRRPGVQEIDDLEPETIRPCLG